MNNVERKLLLLIARYILFKLTSRSGVVPFHVEQDVQTNLPILMEEVERMREWDETANALQLAEAQGKVGLAPLLELATKEADTDRKTRLIGRRVMKPRRSPE